MDDNAPPVIVPYDWQLPLVDRVTGSLRRDRLFISGFPTGAGKTVIALAAARQLGGPHLVVAPKVSLTQWRRTAGAMRCADSLLAVINPEQISKPSGCEFYTRDLKWRLPPGTTVVWDEPHRSASGVKSVATQALAELKAYEGVRLHAMSATLADSPLKLRALGWWAGLHGYNKPSFYSWCRARGCRDVEVGYGSSSAGRSVFQFTKNAAQARAVMAGIRADLGDRFMTLRPEDIPGFPTETLSVRLIDLAVRDRKEIDGAYAEMSERMKSPTKSLMSEMGRERERVEWVMAAAVAELAAAYAEDGNSVVVFFNFTEPRLRFEAAYLDLVKDNGWALSRIYGGQNEAERQRDIDLFQNNTNPCISVMTEAGGAALSLHDERRERPRVSLILPSWNSSTVKQCLGRIRRCNGTHATQHFVLAAGTVQERVAATLQRKLANLAAFNNGFELTDRDLEP